ncbi:Peptidase M15 [Eubacterium maltosivorans]|uniref:YcbK family protein n=1 Tax=Eubacterium maltosivorans TaxID=2041044 RepID=UPI00088AA1EE|nr:D-Ala-D-Ala carboxypeptidase family metallohydrolase [Eubacterium maltosivorans]WPK79461.1 hypothetical protein EUMA32_08680 [Eubacterium maltosivorans]SDP11280.1 Peptidase M15 [Eubacterium maltosivorans]
MKKFYKRIFITLVAVLVIMTSGVFLASFPKMPEMGPEPSPTGEPAAAEPEEPPMEEAGPEPEEPPMASEHFGLWEYACDCVGYCDGWPTEMNPELLERIEALRMACGQPVIITSGVRCEARNEEVGGVSWSFHKKGLAADLYCPGMGVGDLAARAQETGLNILPYYSSGYIHVELPLS